MTYQEKQSLVNMLSGIIITLVYGWIIFQKHQAGAIDLTSDYTKWGILFLIFIGISIAARIIILIIFNILNAIATRETEIPVTDERDKLVKLKSTRNAHYVFSITMVLAFVGLAIGMPVYGVFIVFVFGGLLSEIIETSSQLHFYRKGV